MTGILGSGFGIYGYLPAVLAMDKMVCLLEKSRDTFSKRPELAVFASRINWVEDQQRLLKQVDTLVISVPPKYQAELIKRVGAFPNIRNLIIEKPIASTPDESITILSQLRGENINFRIGYSFFYTSWFDELSKVLNQRKEGKGLDLRINWCFKAHHFKNELHNWKRFSNEGGGTIRFFGIHLIAVLGLLGYTEVSYSLIKGQSADDISLWKASSKDAEGNTASVLVDSNDALERFEIVITEKHQHKQQIWSTVMVSPFDDQSPVSGGLDARTSILHQLYSDLISSHIDTGTFNRYQVINQLWKSYEHSSSFEIKE